MRSALPFLIPLVLLAACSQDAQAPVDSEVDAAGTADDEVLSKNERSLADPTSTGPTAQTGVIPAAMQGRWGLVAADCTSTGGDAKGLIEISDDRIEFYESRGTLDEIASLDARSIRATFSMTGEGMSWTTDTKLALSADGSSLVRHEFGPDATTDTLTYTKCD